MSGKRNLFEESSDDEEEDLNLTINKDYAQRYEEWREAEVKRKLEDKYGNVDEPLSSSSSEDEDDPEELKQVLSKDFFEVISSLKTKDPKIYNPNVEFFKSEKEKGLDPLERKRKKKEEKEKPIFLRDYERKLITERGGKLSDEESDDENVKKRSNSPTYVEEQRALKESFKKALQEDDSDEESGLLKKKEKTTAEKQKEEEDYIEWLKGERAELPDKETEKSLKPLQNLWNDPKLDEGEKFLRDYVLNKRYLEEGDEPLDDGNVTDEDYQDEYMNQFERKFNFRFEEPDREFLKRYPRTMEQSLRRKDTRRKEKRDAVKQRKEEEKKRRKEELKVLKALKRKEILKKIEKIKEITGNDELGLDPDDLEEDFDPEAHDRKMREMFNDDYYDGADDAEEEDGLNLPPLEEELIDDDITNWDEWDGTDKNTQPIEEEEEGDTETYNDDAEPTCEDPEFNMDCDYDPAAAALKREEKLSSRQSAREKRKLKRQSRFGRLVRKEKPVFDPNDKTFEQYVDEYYGMDYEDLIGDIPCRFKYKSVAPNSFGLTIEEILAADDKELNQWASIKKTYSIRPDHVEKYEAKVYAQKAQDEELKRKILPSLYKNEITPCDEAGESGKKKKKKRSKSGDFNHEKSYPLALEEESTENTGMGDNDAAQEKKKKKKKHKSQDEDVTMEPTELPNTIEEINDTSNTEKKKKRKNSKKENHWDNNSEVEPEEVPQAAKEEKRVKKKGKRKLNTDTVIDEAQDQQLNETRDVNNPAMSPGGKPDQKTAKPSDVVNLKTKTKHNREEMSNKQKANKRKFNQGNEGSQADKKRVKKNGEHKNEFSSSKKWSNNKKHSNVNKEEDISDARLKAYGIHPKRYKNKIKYGSQR